MSVFVVTISGNGPGETRELDASSFTVGRSVDCDVQINDTHISRVHVTVVAHGQSIFVEDNGSSNGTFVNENKIQAKTPVSVGPQDKIKLGNSPYFFVVHFKPEKVSELPKIKAENPIVETPVDIAAENKRSSFPALNNNLIFPSEIDDSAKHAGVAAEKILADARKNAAQIVLEAETQAEKKTQAIYEKARETLQQAEALFQAKVAESHKASSAILEGYQQQGQELLRDTRRMSQELREEVEEYVQNIKDRAHQDTSNIISEAKARGVAQAREDADKIIKDARAEAQHLIESAQNEKGKYEKRIDEAKVALEKLKIECETSEDQLGSAIKFLSENKNDLIEAKKKLSNLQDKIKEKESLLSDLEATYNKLGEQKKRGDKAVHALQEKQAQLVLDMKDLEAKGLQAQKEYDSQKVLLLEKIEKEKNEMNKEQKAQIEEMRLELAKRRQKIEQEFFDEIITHRKSIIQSIYGAIEKEIVKSFGVSDWQKVAVAIEKQIADTIDSKMASLSQNAAAASKSFDLNKKRQSENMFWILSGVIVGVLLMYVSQVALERYRQDRTPMQTRLNREVKERQQDFEKRRFNPPQVTEVRDTYVDSVIYTKFFSELYMEQSYQERLYKSLAQYMLKVWRMDEDMSLQIHSVSVALVKELADRKTKIHPDFVKDGIEKMHKLESESLKRMKDLLGSEVRLESYRRFENNFFKEEIQRRTGK